MTKEEIINRMQEAGLKAPARGDFIFIHWDQIALLLAHEIEACAKVCDDLSLSQNSEWEVGTLDCADAIRKRGQA